MRQMNSIVVEGNLTRDPDFRQTPKGTPVCMLSVASNRYYKVDEETRSEVSFFNVETWARVAETCSEYLKKGRGVRVIGRLKQDRWVDQEGKNRDRVVIVASQVDFKPQFRKDQAGAEDGAADEAGVDANEEAAAEIAAENPAEQQEAENEVAAAREKKKKGDDELLEAV